ncbi:MAG: hypothetical protein ABWZ56_00890 [Flavobacterium sp.]
MSTDSPKNVEDQEIDLSLISKKIGGFFQNLNSLVFSGIQFVFRNIIVLMVLLIVGLGLGLFLDKTLKTYDHQIFVTPNFGSTDYLYSKVDLLNSKIKEKDTLFLKRIGINEPKKISKIEIKPIIDIYKFVENKERNFDMLKLLAEDGDLKKIVEDDLTSKNYTYHLISYTTKDISSAEKTLNPLMAYFNESDYFKVIQKEYLNNIQIKMKANDTTIAQIDGVLNQFSNTVGSNQKSDNLVYYNENTQLNEVIKTKDALINEQGSHRIELVNLDKIIKENSFTLNIKNIKSINGKLKFILPLLFIALFLVGYFFRAFYRKQSLLAQQNQ